MVVFVEFKYEFVYVLLDLNGDRDFDFEFGLVNIQKFYFLVIFFQLDLFFNGSIIFLNIVISGD